MFLFPGTSCFPLTPENNKGTEKNKSSVNVVSTEDQVIKILEVVGKQSDKSLKFIKEDSVRSYCQTVQSGVTANSID